MNRVNMVFFYHLAGAITALRVVALGDHKLNDWRWRTQLETTRKWLESFAKAPDMLVKSQQAAADVVIELVKFGELLNEDRVPATDEFDRIVQALNKFSDVYQQEVEDEYFLFVTPLGAYSTKALMDEGCRHLSSAAQASLDDDTKWDFARAAECLVLDLPTASGFHCMRAIEATARSYHTVVTNSKPLTDTPLGPLINGNDKIDGLRKTWEQEGKRNDSNLG